MALFVYVTEECKRNAKQYSLIDEIERFKERVESSQATSQFDPFPPPYLVKKKLGGRQGRLVAEIRAVGEHAVIIFLTIMIRGDRAYEDKFAQDPIGYGNQHFKHLASDTQLSAYIESRTRVEPPPAKTAPTEEEFAFLYEAFAHRQSSAEDDIVYETHEWKEAVSEERIANQLVRFTEPCLEALELNPGLHHVEIPGKQGWGMWIYRGKGSLLLITPITDSTHTEAERVKNHYWEKLQGGGNAENIIRASQRAYPAYMLADEDTWVEIEKEPVANMALSPEESEVLVSARDPDGAFPLFINGRAGSGKSTILQYLFADLLYYYLIKPDTQVMAPPVYLTANGELLQAARRFVERILKNEAAFRHNAYDSVIQGKDDLIGEAFREFRPFLLSLVPLKERRERFSQNNFVDYSRFRQFWKEWFGQDPEASREFGPEVSWHVIRTYIKGMLSEALMDDEEYEQLPESQVSVAKGTFTCVYDRVWEKRYRPLQEAMNLWDDQDLARFIIDNDLAKPLYPAVVCDEAQDFTRMELELLLRLNLFSDRAVPAHDLCRVPFAFAGDQFQTVNPTGFRWETIKVAFTEKFIDALDLAKRSGRTELNYHELKFNYRSTAPIVRFSNGVQALRAATLRMPELRPQLPWAYSKSVFPVVWFYATDTAFWKKFRDVDSFVIVVPCNEGEEARYVMEDPVLREHVRIDDGIPLNVLSAARAKGREYPGVVVYGFGSASPKGLLSLFTEGQYNDSYQRHQLLPLEYFFSRLYVAVSRPKTRLVVVDTCEGVNEFWEYLSRDDKLDQVIKEADRGKSIWATLEQDEKNPIVQGMSMGNVDDLTNDSVGDPLENARAFEEDGRARRDSFLLFQASQAYRSAGEAQKAAECRARALEIERKFLDAARSYCGAGFVIPEGVRSFWKGGEDGWKELIELGKRNPQVARETEFKLARVSLGEGASLENCFEALREISNRMSESDFANEVLTHEAWMQAIEKASNVVLAEGTQVSARQLVDLLEKIETEGARVNNRTMAKSYAKAGLHSKAVRRWELAGDTSSAAYLNARALSDPYPIRLEALSRIEEIEQLIDQYEANKEVALNREQWRVVGHAYLQKTRISDAFVAAWEARDPFLLRQITSTAVARKDFDYSIFGLRALIIAMVFNEDWGSLLKFASRHEFVPNQEWSTPDMQEFVQSQTKLIRFSLTVSLARSDEFVRLPSHRQRQFREHLKRVLHSEEDSWHSYISVEEMGAAFERGGRFSESLAFYEGVLSASHYSPKEKDFSRKRWLVCKSRQVDYERHQKYSEYKLTNLIKELDNALRLSDVENISDIPEFPTLPDLEKQPAKEWYLRQQIASAPETPNTSLPGDTIRDALQSASVPPSTNQAISDIQQSNGAANSAKLTDRVSTQIDDLRIELSRDIGRCNITHQSTMKMAYVSLHDQVVGGELEWKCLSAKEWECDEIDLIFSILDSSLVITHRKLGYSLTLAITSALNENS